MAWAVKAIISNLYYFLFNAQQVYLAMQSTKIAINLPLTAIKNKLFYFFFKNNQKNNNCPVDCCLQDNIIFDEN